MTKKKQALGRGLSALLKENSNIKTAQDLGAKNWIGKIVQIPIKKIVANPYQPRTYFDETALQELSNSIKELGVIQPITVRKKENDDFELISGERRFRASQLAGLKEIPAYVRIANDQEMLEMALVENIQREDLDAIEIALSYQRLIDEVKLTQENLSKRVGKNRSSITNYIRLLKLNPLIQNAIRDGQISMGHGRAILSLETEDQQLNLFDKVVKNALSVRQTEDTAKSIKQQQKQTGKTALPNTYKKIRESLQQKLDTKVNITRANNGKGKIVLTFSSDDDFNRITKLLQ